MRPGRRRLARYWPGVVGGGVLVLVIAAALAAPVAAPFDPTRQNIMVRLTPPLGVEGGRLRLLGTDQLGRDVLSRILFGTRASLVVSAASVAGSAALGLVLGLGAGFLGGAVDALVMRLVELQLAFPVILLALTLVAFLGPTPATIVLVFVVTSWPVYARTLRTSVVAVRELEFVEAARATGSAAPRLLWGHILPNVLSPLIVLLSFELARLIILEASLGFLGFGVQPPTPTWGNMLAEGRDYLDRGWWIAAFPGLAIVLTVGAINFLGDSIRDFLDPRLRTA
jgi:peptide/nickel transport system permease protein